MTETERKARALIKPGAICLVNLENISILAAALTRAIEQHDAYRQEVSDAVVAFMVDKPGLSGAGITRFIIAAKPDPLVEVWDETWGEPGGKPAKLDTFRNALAARGGRIVFDGDAA